MKSLLQWIPKFIQKLILFLFAGLSLMILLVGWLFPQNIGVESHYTLLLTFAICGLLVLTLYMAKRSSLFVKIQVGIGKIRHVYLISALALLCFCIRFIWVWCVRIEPNVDYATFQNGAQELSRAFTISQDSYLSNYLALFPHIFGYASFLGFLYWILGSTSPLIAAVGNVILSTISMMLIYYIAYQLISKRAAIIASIFWISFPSQIIYNMFVLSEPYYTTLLLASFAVIVYMRVHMMKLKFPVYICWAVALGILLAIINSIRPVSAIVLIALAVWLWIIEPLQKTMVGRKVLLVVLPVIVLALGMQINNTLFAARVGYEPAQAPGYNIYVGFNMQSHGRWNQADSDLLFSYTDAGLSPAEAQQRMTEHAIDRITSGEIRFAELFYEKLVTLWGSDTACVGYASSVLSHQTIYKVLCNSYYFFLWLLALLCIFFMWRKNDRSAMVLFPLFIVGISMAHLFVEVAGRYHYAGIISLVMMSAYAVEHLFNRSLKSLKAA